MALTNTLPEVTAAISATTTTDVFTWLTGWIPAIAIDDAMATLKIANAVNTIRVQPVVQFAVIRIDKPSAPTTVGSVQSNDGEYFVSASDYNIGASAPGNTFVRFGVAHHVNTAPNTGRADVAFQLSFRQKGRLLTPWSAHLVATSATKQFIPISGWMTGLDAVKVEGTIVVTDLTGSLELKLTYRTATASPESPDAWDTTGLGSPINSNSENNTGELTPTTTSKMWVQFGLYYDVTAGSLGQADVFVLLGIRSAA